MYIVRSVALVLCLSALTGCAVNRSVVEMQGQQSANPVSGPAVVIQAASDRRVFAIKPPQANIPSLKNDEVNDKALTERAIARKRNSFGAAMGDVLLPEGETVAAQMQRAVAEGFRRAGYRVFDAANAPEAGTPRVDITIEKFWSWLSPGFWAITLANEASVQIKGSAQPLVDPISITTRVEQSSLAATDSDWTAITTKGLDEIGKKVEAELRARATTQK